LALSFVYIGYIDIFVSLEGFTSTNVFSHFRHEHVKVPDLSKVVLISKGSESKERDFSNFLGRGPSYPFRIFKDSGSVHGSAGPMHGYIPKVGEDLEKINGSIHHILSTPKGSRFFLPQFGSRLLELVFDPNDEVLYGMIILYVKEALTEWEPRIEILGIYPRRSEQDDHTVLVSIDYRIIQTNVIGNYVYPFTMQIPTF